MPGFVRHRHYNTGHWGDTTMRKPTSPVAYALLIGNEGVSFTLAPAVSSFMQ